MSDRLDFIAKEFQTIRRFHVRGKHVENAATPAEFTRQLHRVGTPKAVPNQPLRKLIRIDLFFDLELLALLD